ncbi:MAG: transcription elongation factor GreA [Thermodesulfobacteriota bacterium]
MVETVPITREGYEKLKKELTRMVEIERPANVRAIEEARGHGDLSENAEYHAAKERQGFIEGRIQELQVQIGHCQIIEARGPFERAVFGATVTVENVDTGEEKTFTLVGPYESEPEKGRISVSAPLGRALIGKEEGDEVKFRTPKGLQELVITAII